MRRSLARICLYRLQMLLARRELGLSTRGERLSPR